MAFRHRTLRAGDHEQLIEVHREMPTGWPESPHEERDEATITGRTASFAAGDTLPVMIPSWRADEDWFLDFSLWGLPEAVAAVKDLDNMISIREGSETREEIVGAQYDRRRVTVTVLEVVDGRELVTYGPLTDLSARVAEVLVSYR